MAAGIILAGGQSSRMGRDKATLFFDGETLLARAVRMLSTAVSPIIVSARAGQELPTLDSATIVVRDAVPERGPLGGLHAALEHVAADEIAFVMACDLPRLTAEVVHTILASLDATCDAVVPRIAGRPQPLAAVYRASILPIVAEHVAEQRLSMTALVDALAVKYLDGFDHEQFLNVNTPDDYANLK